MTLAGITKTSFMVLNGLRPVLRFSLAANVGFEVLR